MTRRTTLRPVRVTPRHVIEPLEERCAPAVFIVNVTSDAPDQTAIGDGVVDSDLATDGNTSTAWSTEWYHVQTLGEIGRASCRERVSIDV